MLDFFLERKLCVCVCVCALVHAQARKGVAEERGRINLKQAPFPVWSPAQGSTSQP